MPAVLPPAYDGYMTAIESFNNMSLSDSMQVYKSRLEREQAAMAAGPAVPRVVPRRAAYEGPGMDLKIHKSRVEMEKEAMLAGPEVPRISPRPAAYGGPGLSETLRVHKSQLELNKEAMLAGPEVPRRPPPSLAERIEKDGYVPLEHTLRVHKSRLELQKEEALKERALKEQLGPGGQALEEGVGEVGGWQSLSKGG
jgi:hypothetical protein